jgi:hypothetical protein
MIAETSHRRIRAAWWLPLVPVLLAGCAGRYFHEVAMVPHPPPRHALHAWPYHEYWTGIVFNGEKIGLTHLALIPTGSDERRYELRAEALLAFHFLGFNKSVTLKARDWVTDDLRLERFAHEYDLDGRKLKLSGRVERVSGDAASTDLYPLTEPVYPTSAVPLYPTLHGLEVGRHYEYLVYEGQRQQLLRVTQDVNAYQESETVDGEKLFEGRAYRIVTSLGGQESTTWINERGEPVLEMTFHGILISTLESEKRAKAYLARAGINKREVLLEFSRVRSNIELPRPRETTAMQVALQGLPAAFVVPSDSLQQCRRESDRVQCLIQVADPSVLGRRPKSLDFDLNPYLTPTAAIQSGDSRIAKTALAIVETAPDPVLGIRLLVEWIRKNVEQKPVDVFTSLDVLEGMKAECQGLTLLYAAFARSLGIPTRVMSGLVYSQEYGGFLYHTWAESHVGLGWLPVDPTFGQVGADATHIKLIEGDRMADLLPLVDLMGKIRLEILSVQPS